MLDTEAALAALQLLSSSAEAWLVLIPGILIGLAFSAVPGLTISIAMAVFLPATLYMDFLPALIFLTAIYTGGAFGSAIPAILFNVPGQPAAMATTFDGYPMTQQGRHNEALGIGLMSSVAGAALGYIILMLLVDPIARLVLNLGPLEMLIVALWGLTMIAGIQGGNFARGLLAGIVGLLLGTVGFSARGDIRGTLGLDWLLDGIPAVSALIGALAASELFNLMRSDYIVADQTARRLNFRRILSGVGLALSYPVVLLRGGLIGMLVGAVPGVGGSVANLISYAETRRRSKDPAAFGKGDPRGVIAAESANSSSEGGSMAILLALGIPGGGGTAVMLGAFALHNITGGPRFMSDHKDIVFAVIFSNMVQALALLVIGVGFIWLASAIVKMPVRVLVPSVLALATFGCYSLAGNMSGPITLFVFTALGWLMRHYGYSVVALIIGLLLGRMVEGSMLRTYQISGGDPAFLLERPIAMVLFGLFVLSLFWPMFSDRVRHRFGAASNGAPRTTRAPRIRSGGESS